MSTLALTKILEDWGLEGVAPTPDGPHVCRDPRGQITCLILGQSDHFVWEMFFNHRDAELFSVAHTVDGGGQWDSQSIGAVRFPTRAKTTSSGTAATLFRDALPTLFPNLETALAATAAEDWLLSHRFVIPAGL